MKLIDLISFELRKLIVSKSTWILMAIFVCLTQISTFFLGGFLIINQASLLAFLKFVPVCIALFAFLVSFNSNTKESKKANHIKISSMPIDLRKLVIAKYLANLALAFIFILLSSSIVFTISYLGNPDWMLVASGIFACFLFFMLCFSITSFTSTFSRSSFESFGYSVLTIFILCLTGFGAISTMLEIILPQAFVIGLTKYSILTSFNNIASGYIGLNDFVLYVSLIGLFLAASILYANKNIYKVKLGKAKLLAMFIITLAINTSVEGSKANLDLTADKIYSVSDNLVNITNKLGSQPVTITYYYSKSNKSIPLETQRLADYTNKFLLQLEEKSNGKIIYHQVDPDTNENFEIEALREKVAEIPLPNGDRMFNGISLRQGQLVHSIAYLTVAKKSFLEYDIAHLLVNFTKKDQKKKIGILTELDLGNEDQTPAFLRELLKRYDVDLIPLTYPVFPKYDLVIAFVTPFLEESSLYAADQYLVNGGKMLVLFDPFFRTAPETDFLMPDRKADGTAFDHLADLLRFYGVEYDYNAILGDTTRAMSTSLPGVGVTNYPLWVLFSEAEMNKSLPIFEKLNNIIIPEGGFFEVNRELLPDLTLTPLLTSTNNSQTVSRALFNTLGDAKSVASRLRGEKKQRDAAIMLDGNFLSAYQEMPADIVQWFKEAERLEGADFIPQHKTTSENKGVLVAIADMDFMSDHFSTYGEKNLDGTINKKPISDNQFFLTNTIDYLMNDYDLISLRSKGDNLRTLSRVEQLIVDDIAKKDFQENALIRTIELATNVYKTMISRQKNVREPQEFVELNQIIIEKQKEIVLAKRELKVYKRSLKQTVEDYIRKVALLNVLFAPVILMILGFIFFLSRRYKRYL